MEYLSKKIEANAIYNMSKPKWDGADETKIKS